MGPFPVPLGGVAAVRRTPGEADDLRMSSSLGLKMTRSTLYPPFSRIEDGHDSGKYGEWSLRGQSWDRSHAQAKTFDPRYPQRSPSTSFERVQYHTTCSPPPLGWRVARAASSLRTPASAGRILLRRGAWLRVPRFSLLYRRQRPAARLLLTVLFAS